MLDFVRVRSLPVIKERRSGPPKGSERGPGTAPDSANRPIREATLQETPEPRGSWRVLNPLAPWSAFRARARTGCCGNTHRYKYSTFLADASDGGWAWPISSGSEIRSNEASPSPCQGVSTSVIRYSRVSSNHCAITSTRSVPSGRGFASLSIISAAEISPDLMYLFSSLETE